MNEIKNKKMLFLIIIFIIIIFLVVMYFISRNNIVRNEGLIGDYDIINKKYGVNEYSVVNISDEQLVNIYLNNFRYYLFYETDSAYELLDDNYRNVKFGSIDMFKKYVNSLNYKDLSVKKYSISEGKNLIEVHTKNNEVFVFRIKGIFDYKVYLDDYTVEILIN